MRLSRLALRHFRNLRNQELELPSEGVALIGDNAQGKSNFLEAIYYLETLRSFRSARDDQLVRFGEDVFRIVGTAESDARVAEGAGDAEEGDRGGQTKIAAAFQKRGRRKKVTIDGQESERLTDALGRLSAVIFSPADVELVSGGPSERRRFLDIVLSLNERGYVKSLQDYRKILQRRNAALKAGAATSSVAAWEPGLVRSGAEVMAARQRWVDAKCEAFGDYYAAVSDEARAVMSYTPDVSIPLGAGFQSTASAPGAASAEGAASTEGSASTEGLGHRVDAIADAFREALRDSSDRERRRGLTVVGPHRDDVRLRLEDEDDGMDLRDYGSGGQRRTAALALKLVEAMTIREHRSRNPMILLDDVFAELDPGRSERVLELMEHEEIGQVVITAPKEADVRIRRDQLPRWRIADGVIEA